MKEGSQQHGWGKQLGEPWSLAEPCVGAMEAHNSSLKTQHRVSEHVKQHRNVVVLGVVLTTKPSD